MCQALEIQNMEDWVLKGHPGKTNLQTLFSNLIATERQNVRYTEHTGRVSLQCHSITRIQKTERSLLAGNYVEH